VPHHAVQAEADTVSFLAQLGESTCRVTLPHVGEAICRVTLRQAEEACRCMDPVG
jgi:hypothetical protein